MWKYWYIHNTCAGLSNVEANIVKTLEKVVSNNDGISMYDDLKGHGSMGVGTGGTIDKIGTWDLRIDHGSGRCVQFDSDTHLSECWVCSHSRVRSCLFCSVLSARWSWTSPDRKKKTTAMQQRRSSQGTNRLQVQSLRPAGTSWGEAMVWRIVVKSTQPQAKSRPRLEPETENKILTRP